MQNLLWSLPLLALLAATWAYWLIAWWCLRRFMRQPRLESGRHGPSVSVLKPIKGVDQGAYENFASFCRQDYADYEILFGVADAADPAVALVERLRAEFPERRIGLHVAESIGANPKVSLLHHLSLQAQGQVLVLTDSDVRVGPDCIKQVIAPLRDPAIGLVTCLYRGDDAASLPAKLESLYIDTTFVPSMVLASQLAGNRVAPGAMMALRSRELDEIGGFCATADYLADDYQLASRIEDVLGLKAHLTSLVVPIILGKTTLRQQWNREVRWMRTICACEPRKYPGLLFTLSTPLALVMAAIPLFWPFGWIALIVSLLVRWFVAWHAIVCLGQKSWAQLVWLPLRDVLTAMTWLAGFFGQSIVWRNHRYRLTRSGRLEPWSHRTLEQAIAETLRAAVRWLDGWLRRRDQIWEYSQHEKCLFRVNIVRAGVPCALTDGTRVRAGDVVGDLHFWNEHMPRMAARGSRMRWALDFDRRMRLTMRHLAEAVQIDPRLADAKAFHAQFSFTRRDTVDRMTRRVRNRAGLYGMELSAPLCPDTFWHRGHDFLENFLLAALVWAYNPGAAQRAIHAPAPPHLDLAQVVDLAVWRGRVPRG